MSTECRDCTRCLICATVEILNVTGSYRRCSLPDGDRSKQNKQQWLFMYGMTKQQTCFLFSSLLSASLGCARPLGVQHGDLLNRTEANRGSFPPGTLLTYGCEPGYTADGPTSIICTSSGGWSHQPPSCVRSNGEQNTKNVNKELEDRVGCKDVRDLRLNGRTQI